MEDLALVAPVAAAAPEYFPALEPADEFQLVGSRHPEALAIHLRVRNLEVLADPRGDGMTRLNHPHPFLLAGLAPAQFPRRSHELTEDPGVVGGVQGYEAHSPENAIENTFDNTITHVVVGQAPPPDQHVTVGQGLRGEAVFRLVKDRGADDYTLSTQVGRDRLVQPVRVAGHRPRVGLLVAILVPYGNAWDPAHTQAPND